MTKKGTTGIVNPFEKPKPKKKNFVSPYEDVYGMEAETRHLRTPDALDLDGDSYIVRFLGGVTLENLAEKLIDLLYDVNKQFKEHLNDHGIWTGEAKKGCLVLRHSKGVVSIYKEEDNTGNEVEGYRRIGLALFSLPQKQVLKHHKIKIIKRG
jgi:hypothetical protein